MKTFKSRSFKSARSRVFYLGFLFLPLLQFCIFYVGVNVNSFILAFRKISSVEGSVGRYTYGWTFANFANWFTDNNEFQQLWQTLKISLKSYAISLVIGVPLGLFFAYYIFKKLPGAMFFRFMLFLPSIIASIVLVTIFKYFTDYVVPDMLGAVGIKTTEKLLSGKARYATVMFYNLFVSFGTTVLLYSNKMASIPPEIIEAAELDGAGATREFFSVVLPQTFSTLSIFLVAGVAGLFTNEINNFSFFNTTWKPDTATLGFLMYFRTQKAKGDVSQYPPLAALGLMMSAVAIPLTFLVRWLLKEFGPSED